MEMSQYLFENNKTGHFNPQRTLSGLFFIIPKLLAPIRAVVLAFTTNKQTSTLNSHISLHVYNLSLLLKLAPTCMRHACCSNLQIACK